MTDDAAGGGLAVGIDVSAIPAEPRGAGRYVLELVSALHRRRQIEVHLQTRRNDGNRWAALAPRADVRCVAPDSPARRLVWEQAGGARFVDRWGIAVHHGPHYTMPERAKVAKVVTVHDLTFFDHPEWHERVKVPVFRRAVRVAARHAQALICVSAPTARRLQELLDPQCQVHVIEHGIDHDLFRTANEPGAVAQDEAKLAALGIRPPYFAFLGTLEPRKDVATLVAAFDSIAADHSEHQLAIVGGVGWRAEAFERALLASPFAHRIVCSGYVDQQVVPALLRRAAVVVYPAIEEGFGLPALEALACGAPLLTTKGSVMEEVAAGAASVVPAGDVAAMGRVLDSLVRNGPDDERRTLGLAVAASHTWDATAAAHERVYAAAEALPRRR